MMKKILQILTWGLIMLVSVACGDKLYKEISYDLNNILSQREIYFQHQLEHIQKEEQKLLESIDKRERFEICYHLFNLSKSYKYDIAYKYSKEALNIAKEIGDPNLICRAESSQISTFTSGGLFTEASKVIQAVNIEGVDSLIRRALYYNIVRYYSDQIDYNNGKYRTNQLKEMRSYTDSIITLSPTKDYYYTYAKCYKEMSVDNYSQVINDLLAYYGSEKISAHHNSIITFLLGYAYFQIGEVANGFKFLTLSVGYDVEAAARENRSIKTMSEHLFAINQIAMAERLIEIAFEDATFYNARHRNLEVNMLLSIINKHKIATISQHRNILYSLLFVITILSIAAIVFGVKIHRQAKITKASKQTIQEQMDKLSEINTQLLESNKIKEHYIINSLYKSNEHLKQNEAILKKIDLKIKNRLYNDLRYLYKDFNIKQHKERFFDDFDRTFLNLFPNFMVEYNSLFQPKDQININASSELPPEVRIFALMRLGITDNEQISRFLDLSINTIYTYKTKVKGRSVIPKHEFESRILNIRLNREELMTVTF